MASVEEKLYTEIIKRDFCNYYEENYYDEDFEEFKEIAIEEMYNSVDGSVVLPFSEIYSHLIFFLKVVKEELTEFDYFFKDWDNPQKVYKLGMYYLAKNVITSLSEDDVQVDLDTFVDEESEEEEETKDDIEIVEPSQ